MKKTFKYFALFVMGLTLSACSDDDLVNNPTYTVGDEIVFGASASVEAGNENAKDSRTAYGDPIGNKIPLNWAANDQIDIVCPEALDAKSATYEVQVGTTASNTSSLLKRISAGKGLQWSAAPVHNFYAVYPSISTLDFTESQISKEEIGLNQNTQEGVSYLPVKQTNSSLVNKVPEIKVIEGVPTYVVEPNMKYAYMLAHTPVTAENASKNITLAFTPIVTALEFQITVDQFLNQNVQGKKPEIQLTSCVLSSVDGSDICGKFACSFKNHTIVNKNANPGEHNQIAIDLPAGIILSKDGTKSCNVTFFMLPTDIVKAKNLKLKIFYRNNGTVQFKTAVIGKDIQPRKKYFFKNLVMPPIDSNINGSLWFSGIEDNVLVSQLSIPCAGNAFSNNETDVNFREQVYDYLTLWNQGVRGFEFVNQADNTTDTGVEHVNGHWEGPVIGGHWVPGYDKEVPFTKDLFNQPFVCGEKKLTGGETFGSAMQKLVNILNTDRYKNEFLLIIAKYHAVEGGFLPGTYVRQLCAALSKLEGVTQDRFVKLTPNTTVKDLRGKIAVVVRPADDAYIQFEHGKDAKLTKDIAVIDNNRKPWADNILVVHNWGKAYDRWDMRYDGCAREATWKNGVGGNGSSKVDGNTVYEDWLWASSSSDKTFTAVKDYKKDAFPTAARKYDHTTSTDGLVAQVQEWARVIPKNATYASGNGVYEGQSSNGKYLWLKWPSSIGEKKTSINELLLKSVKRADDDNSLYINVLSGYYPTVTNMKGVVPFKYNFALNTDGVNDVVRPEGQGNGGNYADLAADLNLHLFNVLAGKKKIDGQKLPEGPWGIIVMDYLGAKSTDDKNAKDAERFNTYGKGEFHKDANYSDAAFASNALVYMIMMNNFQFPLRRSQAASSNANLEIQQSTDVIVAD